jgi:hypothetical protein
VVDVCFLVGGNLDEQETNEFNVKVVKDDCMIFFSE